MSVSVNDLADWAELLVCPTTGLRLTLHTLADASAMMGYEPAPLRGAAVLGNLTQVLVREDHQAAYPVIDGIPVLLVPEMLGRQDDGGGVDLGAPRYAEAYEEMEFYNRVAREEAQDIRSSDAYARLKPLRGVTADEVASFPRPMSKWLDAIYDCAAQWDSYCHISPIQGRRTLQLGGKGLHAVKFLIAGAREAWVLAPMIDEVRCAMVLAEALGVGDRLRCVVAVAEELPFISGSFDAIYAGGCLHHMVMGMALKEAARVMSEGGRFAASDPWRAPLYAIGTRLFGKREADAHCHPLTKERIVPLHKEFGTARVVRHGTLTRYPLLALQKLGLPSSLLFVWQMNRIDDAICSCFPGMREMGSSITCLGVK